VTVNEYKAVQGQKVKRKKTKGRTMINKTLHKKLKIKQDE